MSALATHPTVLRVQKTRAARDSEPVLDADGFRRDCLELGADDVGFVEIDRPELASQRADILSLLPRARTLVSLVVRMNRDDVRNPARSLANLEFHHATDEVDEIARRIARLLEDRGIAAVNAASGFPMEADRWPRRMWVISHKPVAVAAGLGVMGIHRNVIHPRFGSFVLLGTVVTEARIAPTKPLDFNPCVECKLCVAACPTGAIHPDGRFDFSACYTHNYREFMGGFTDWVETVADSSDRFDYRRRVRDAETVSIWQSLSLGPNYKAAYCVAVCPAGEDVLGPFVGERPAFLQQVVKPLQDKVETIYVTRGSDAESFVPRRYPHKSVKVVGNGLRPDSIAGFLFGITLTFQRGRAEGLDATYHFTFTGDERREATIRIVEGTLTVIDGHVGTPDFRLTADARTWLRFLAKEVSLLRAVLTRRIRFRGSPRLLLAFARCFPS